MERPNQLDRAYLDRLVTSHLIAVPFEALELYTGRREINLELVPDVRQNLGPDTYWFEQYNEYWFDLIRQPQARTAGLYRGGGGTGF